MLGGKCMLIKEKVEVLWLDWSITEKKHGDLDHGASPKERTRAWRFLQQMLTEILVCARLWARCEVQEPRWWTLLSGGYAVVILTRLTEETEMSKHPCQTEISAKKESGPWREPNRNDLTWVGGTLVIWHMWEQKWKVSVGCLVMSDCLRPQGL